MKLQTLKSRIPRLNTGPVAPRMLETQRLRGQRAVDRRARWLALHPLCCMCDAEGKTRAGDVVDHITPLWAGGADDESNLQTLCQTPHHDAKSKAEAAQRARGYSAP